MSPAILTIGALAVLAYLGGAAALFHRLSQGLPGKGGRWLAVAMVGLAIHFGLLVYNATAVGIDLSFFDALSVVAWIVTALLIVGSLAWPIGNLGVVVLPITAVSLALGQTMGAGPGQPIDVAWPLDLHIGLAILAFAILSLAAAQAIVLAAQERALRHHDMQPFWQSLPPLSAMENLLFQFLGTGFAILTLALVAGMFFVDDLMGQHLVHKTTLSVIGWVIFGVLLWGRWRFGWRGRKAVNLTLVGMATLLLAYFGSKMVLELILERV